MHTIKFTTETASSSLGLNGTTVHSLPALPRSLGVGLISLDMIYYSLKKTLLLHHRTHSFAVESLFKLPRPLLLILLLLLDSATLNISSVNIKPSGFGICLKGTLQHQSRSQTPLRSFFSLMCKHKQAGVEAWE